MLSLILPTYNEAQTLPSTVDDIVRALQGQMFEIIVVDDDSPDGTWRIAQQMNATHPSVRVIHRRGGRGLSSAVVAGFAAARGEVFAVMDADGQHDPALLVPMLHEVTDGGAGLVIGSRYMAGGSVGRWNVLRKMLSASGTFLTRLGLGRNVTDPLSGLFMIRRDCAAPLLHDFHPQGFKILLDLLIRLPKNAVVRELPFVFRTRRAGQSKLTFGVHLAVLRTLFPLLAQRFAFSAFLLLCAVIVFALLPRALALAPLYTDSFVRLRAQATLTQVADRQGWLLSDIALVQVEQNRMTLVHQSHGRLSLPALCHRVSLSTPITYAPCTDAR